jgi:hypothetical protein
VQAVSKVRTRGDRQRLQRHRGLRHRELIVLIWSVTFTCCRMPSHSRRATKEADKRVEKLLRALEIARQQEEGKDLAAGMDKKQAMAQFSATVAEWSSNQKTSCVIKLDGKVLPVR